MFDFLTVAGIWSAVQQYAAIAGVTGIVLAVVGYRVMKRLLVWGASKV